ncbi:hypothetical protein PIB30_048776 [Stylosanthes scabra]|uniref:Transposase n=1 Tax=Stylosanthes scabra TaxID=79078 RepID=A0ABU6UGJ1_9FABA|nr:hypothetical protein [Stylosanthes scabra]
MKSWHEMKEYKEFIYNDVIKRTFHFEDTKGEIKKVILARLGKLWKNTRSNLFHTFYDETKSLDENVKSHKPRGMDLEHWRFFLKYWLSEKTQEKCRKNTENRSKQMYTHTRGSMTLARRREEEEHKQGKKFSRGEIWTMTHKKSDGSYIYEDARTIVEAIQVIESCNQSTKELSQNDSLVQVLGKEHPERVRGVGVGSCPTQIIKHGTQ